MAKASRLHSGGGKVLDTTIVEVREPLVPHAAGS